MLWELQSPDTRYQKRAHLQEELKVAMCTACPCGPHVHCQIFVVFLARVGIKVLYPL